MRGCWPDGKSRTVRSSVDTNEGVKLHLRVWSKAMFRNAHKYGTRVGELEELGLQLPDLAAVE